jgi:hypothetical protein
MAEVSAVELGAMRLTVASPLESVTADDGLRLPLVVVKLRTFPDIGVPPEVRVTVIV